MHSQTPSRVDLLPPDHERVQRFTEMMFALRPLQPPAAILFGGDRWNVVEVVGVLSINERDAGMATLAPTNELGSGGPTVIALWVDPELPTPDRFSFGAALLKVMADEALRRYSKVAFFPAITETELGSALEAQKQGVQLTFRDLGGGITPRW